VSRTARTRPAAPRTSTALFAGALVGALVLTGCGAGQIAGTAEQQSAVSGGSSSGMGPIVVRDAVIVFGEQVEGDAVYPRGSSAPLSMTIVNEGTEADTLVSASSPWASSVEISGVTEIPAARSIVVEGEPAEAAPGTGVPTSGAPSAAPTTTPAAPAEAESGTQIVLTGLLDDIRAGISYEVTLVFERAGEVVVPVPVGDAEEPREDEPAE
jgi:copper(I)-binding protein